MNPGGDEAAQGSWSRYWATGALHSCPNAFAGNYDDEIREHWMAFFGALPDGATILDIGTGNGAVAFLAREAGQANHRTFRIEAIDAAVIDPATAAARCGIDVGDIVFHGGTRCEDTGYPDGHFDAVSGQYAIEYSDTGASLRELARILVPGGAAGFVIHHASSEAVTMTRAELRAFDYLRHEAPLLMHGRRLLRKLLPAVDRGDLAARLQDREMRKKARELDRLLRRATAFAQSHRGAAFVAGIAKQVAIILQHASEAGPATALDRLAVLETEMAAHQDRLRAIVTAAQDRRGIDALCARAASHGFAGEVPRELRRRGQDLLGWVCSFRLGS